MADRALTSVTGTGVSPGAAADPARTVLHRAQPLLDDALRAGTLPHVAGELLAFAELLGDNLRLRRTVTNPGVPSQARRDVVRALLADRAHATTVRVLDLVTEAPWLAPADRAGLPGRLGVQAAYAWAQADDVLEDVEDELFRFARLLDRERDLRAVLTGTDPVDRRTALARSLLAGRVRPQTVRLVEHALRLLRGHTLEHRLERLAYQAAAFRGAALAEVVTATPLTDAQAERLTESLHRRLGHPVHLRVTVDPALRGGAVITVGANRFDGSVRRQLARVRQELGV